MMRLRWAPGFQDHLKKEGRVPEGRDDWDYEAWPVVPDPDDPATAGCLLRLLGPLGTIMHELSRAGRMDVWSRLMHSLMHDPEGLGRACIAAAEVNGRWI